MTPDKAGPTRAFVGRWGEGRMGGGLGIIGIDGQKGERMGTTQWKWDFFQCIVQAHTDKFAAKKNKVKITQCSDMSKFCPPAAPSRRSRRGNNYERMRSHADGWWGGGGTQQNWQGSVTSLAQTAFLFWGAPSKNMESDSKTGNLIFRETKG